MAIVTLTEDSGAIVVCPKDIEVGQNWDIEFDGSQLSKPFQVKFEKLTLKKKKAKQWYTSSGEKLLGKSRYWGGGKYDVRFDGDLTETQARMIIKPPGFAWAINLSYFLFGALVSFVGTHMALS